MAFVVCFLNVILLYENKCGVQTQQRGIEREIKYEDLMEALRKLPIGLPIDYEKMLFAIKLTNFFKKTLHATANDLDRGMTTTTANY